MQKLTPIRRQTTKSKENPTVKNSLMGHHKRRYEFALYQRSKRKQPKQKDEHRQNIE